VVLLGLVLFAGWVQSTGVIDIGFEVETHKIRTMSIVDKEKQKIMTTADGNGGQWDVTIDGSRPGKTTSKCAGTPPAVTATGGMVNGRSGYLETKTKKQFPTDAATMTSHFVDYCKAIQLFRDHFDGNPYCPKADIMVDAPADKDAFKMNDVQINVGYRASMLTNEKTFMDNFVQGSGGASLLVPVAAISGEAAVTANAGLANIINMWWNVAVWLSNQGKSWNAVKDFFTVLPKWDMCEVVGLAVTSNVITDDQFRHMATALNVATLSQQWTAQYDSSNQGLPNPFVHFWPYDSFASTGNRKRRCSFSANSFNQAPKYRNSEFEILFEYRKIAKAGDCATMVSAVETAVKTQLKAQNADCSAVTASAGAAITACYNFLTAQVPTPPAPQSQDDAVDFPAEENMLDPDDGEGVFTNDAFDDTITDEEARQLIGTDLLKLINDHPDDYVDATFVQTKQTTLKARLQNKQAPLQAQAQAKKN